MTDEVPTSYWYRVRYSTDGEESSHERHAARERGEVVSVPSKAVAFAANKEEQLNAVRLETLVECQTMLLKARNFAVWLETRIQSLKRGRR